MTGAPGSVAAPGARLGEWVIAAAFPGIPTLRRRRLVGALGLLFVLAAAVLLVRPLTAVVVLIVAVGAAAVGAAVAVLCSGRSWIWRSAVAIPLLAGALLLPMELSTVAPALPVALAVVLAATALRRTAAAVRTAGWTGPGGTGHLGPHLPALGLSGLALAGCGHGGARRRDRDHLPGDRDRARAACRASGADGAARAGGRPPGVAARAVSGPGSCAGLRLERGSARSGHAAALSGIPGGRPAGSEAIRILYSPTRSDGSAAVASAVVAYPLYRIELGRGPTHDRLAQKIATGVLPAPLFLGQGVDDEVVPIAMQDRLSASICAAGRPVETREYAGRTHMGVIAQDSPLIEDVAAWTAAVTAGLKPSNCAVPTVG